MNGFYRSNRLKLSVVFGIILSFLIVFTSLPHQVLAQEHKLTFPPMPKIELPKFSLPWQTETQQVWRTTDNITSTANITATDVLTPVNIVSVEAGSGNETSLKTKDGKLTLKIPKGAVSKRSKIEMKEFIPSGSTGMKMLRLFELTASAGNTTEKISKFNSKLEITIQHSPGELDGLDTNSLRLFYLDEKTQTWQALPGKYNPEDMTLVATTTHFTYFGEQANPLRSGPGRVMAGQVNLYSGAATFSYPFELPPGPGGFRPKLELSYSSGSVDEMKNKRDVGSWVGIGWNLHLGRISYSGGAYYLDLSGSSYELFSNNATSYVTKPDEHFQITRSGNTWEALDRSGNYYRFGGTTASQQYNGANYYRWDLSRFRDTNGNQVDVAYVQNVRSGTVRSAYPSSLTYGNTVVTFGASSDYNPYNPYDGNIRWDNPKTYLECWWDEEYGDYCLGNYAPTIMEDKRLDYIEVKTDSTLIRKYQFAYQSTNAIFSSDYSGIYYAGQMKLTSIKQIGADNTSTLPPMAFTYQNLSIYRHGYGSGNTFYIGNPGNPSLLTYPYLTNINSGYGGAISFTYSAAGGGLNIWSHQVVATKITNGGVGAPEIRKYEYTGAPVYLGDGWDQKFRGFGEVKELYAGGYTTHKFYTTGNINGRNAELLTGREYETKRYDNSSTLLETKAQDWVYDVTTNYTSYAQLTPVYVTQWSSWSNGSYPHFYNPVAISVDPDGYVYVIDKISANNHYVRKFTSNGAYVTQWSSWVDGGYQYFYNPVAISVDPDGNVYIVDKVSANNHYVRKFTSSGTYVTQWSSWVDGGYQYFYNPVAISVSSDGYVYVIDKISNYYQYVRKFTSGGTYVTQWSRGYQYLYDPVAISVAPDGNVYVIDKISANNNYVHKFTSSGTYVTQWSTWYTGYFNCFYDPVAISVAPDGYVPDGYVYVIDTDAYGSKYVRKFRAFITIQQLSWRVFLNQSEETIGSKTSRVRYVYDSYGNLTTTYLDGDTSTQDDDATAHTTYYPNTTLNILNKPARERVYTGITDDVGGANLKKETLYYYDGNNSANSAPSTVGNLTRLEQKKDATNSVSSYFSYDSYGNTIATQDANGNSANWTFESVHHTYPLSKAYPASGLSESYTWDYGSTNMLSMTDANGQVTGYEYDTFKRLLKVIKPGDSSGSPGTEYQYNNWGTLNQQHIKTLSKINGADYHWQSEYFDGLGRVTQTQSRGETGRTIISGSTAYEENQMTVTEILRPSGTGSANQLYGSPTGGDHWRKITDIVPDDDNTYIIGGQVYGWYYGLYTVTPTLNTGVINYVKIYARSKRVDYGLNVARHRTAITTNGGVYYGDTVDPGTSYSTTSTQYNTNPQTGQPWTWAEIAALQIGVYHYAYWEVGEYEYYYSYPATTQIYAEVNYTATTSRGLTGKAYVAQDLPSANVSGYKAPEANWKYSSSQYDALGRVTSQTGADGATLAYDYSTPWQTIFTNERGFKKVSVFDAFGRLTQVQELNGSHQLYATTEYTYDTLGQLTQVKDADDNITSISYDWLSRKTGMTDPDMGGWSYVYDNNGNLTGQTDAKSQTITFSYDSLNRLTAKTYPQGSNMTGVAYSYDSVSGGNYGKGRRTGMTDAIGATAYTYDSHGRLIQESRTVTSDNNTAYTTRFGYDSADRNTWLLYPTGENVTQSYNGRGLPYALSGATAGNLVTGVLYNQLGQVTEINLGNGLRTTYGYWGTGGGYDTSGGYYGRLWEIKTLPQAGGTALQQVQHTWDAVGNLAARNNILSADAETFSYDFLDRLTGVSGNYTQSFSYNEIGNILSMNGVNYAYGSQPHAVTATGSANYTYDSNGNMLTGAGRTIAWDVENRPTSITTGNSTATFVYDGDGNRALKTEGGQTTLYINKYYEKSLTSGNATAYYFLGGRLIGMKEGAANVTYVHQDHLTGTSVVSNSAGALVSSIAYAPFGSTRAGAVSTDIKFTGQRLDATGLYFYNARYYDPQIGRFISADTKVTDPGIPQAYNRYSYTINNPLKYIDPSGRDYIFVGGNGMSAWDPRWISMLVALNWDPLQDKVHFIGDTDGGYHDLDATDQYNALNDALGSGTYENIKIISFSEGAAATAQLLSDMSEGIVASNDEIEFAFMLETPRDRLQGYDSKSRDGLGMKAAKMDIRAVDIRNNASYLNDGAPDWGKYGGVHSYGDWYDPLSDASWWGSMGGLAYVTGVAVNTVQQHSNILTDDATMDYIMAELMGM